MNTSRLSGFVIVLCLALLLSSTPVLLTPKPKYNKFVLVPSPQFGPTRLDQGWKGKSLASCIGTCRVRYPQTCESVMYNTFTHMCTPGDKLNQSQPRPDVTEGQLYTKNQCYDENFDCISYGNASACLYRFTSKVQYEQAESGCSDLDSHLYTMRSVDKLYLLQEFTDRSTWIGLNDIAEKGVFVWVDNGDVIDSSLINETFAPTEPNDQEGTEDCVVLRVSGDIKLLNDDKCNNSHQYVCEKNVLSGY